MEASAPKKIYIHVRANKELGTTWHGKKITNSDIEYIRKDAFIEKAKEAFCKAACNGCPPRSTCTSLGTCNEHDNFVKLLKREEL